MDKKDKDLILPRSGFVLVYRYTRTGTKDLKIYNSKTKARKESAVQWLVSRCTSAPGHNQDRV